MALYEKRYEKRVFSSKLRCMVIPEPIDYRVASLHAEPVGRIIVLSMLYLDTVLATAVLWDSVLRAHETPCNNNNNNSRISYNMSVSL